MYEYFKNKEDLLLSIPAKRFQAHLDAMPETFHIRSPLRKLRRLMRYHFSLYLPNQDFLKLFLTDIQLNIRFYESAAFATYRGYMQIFETVVAEGQAAGDFRSAIVPRVLRNMFSALSATWRCAGWSSKRIFKPTR